MGPFVGAELEAFCNAHNWVEQLAMLHCYRDVSERSTLRSKGVLEGVPCPESRRERRLRGGWGITVAATLRAKGRSI
jgi:hypothetical protein